jgi:hypothetical protein
MSKHDKATFNPLVVPEMSWHELDLLLQQLETKKEDSAQWKLRNALLEAISEPKTA